ncbi:GntR family transcriptional regulator [Rhizobium sp. BK251]|uniref:GntR family transcriptional regulator n=1 Tax=Rhizobium sp. BK251 TaxID=2512125 RepID=UPI001404AFD7|nr:GntR family transcriptional regulator [Rhizobium sp. BK251]
MEPIRRLSMHEEVLLRIREMIVQGSWTPGEVIPELEISNALQVSRTPVREALKVLIAEGLLISLPRQGAMIKLITPQEAHDVLEATGEIEAAAGRRAVKRATDAKLRKIDKLHERMVQAFDAGERAAYFTSNLAIHRAIVEAGGNEVMATLHGTLVARMQRIRYACTNLPANWKGAVDEHVEIIDALHARDADRLARVLIAHMEGGWQRVRAFVVDENRAPASAPPARSGSMRRHANAAR